MPTFIIKMRGEAKKKLKRVQPKFQKSFGYRRLKPLTINDSCSPILFQDSKKKIVDPT
jgi:hypothetical protein